MMTINVLIYFMFCLNKRTNGNIEYYHADLLHDEMVDVTTIMVKNNKKRKKEEVEHQVIAAKEAVSVAFGQDQ
jgi:hypothetical protein